MREEFSVGEDGAEPGLVEGHVRLAEVVEVRKYRGRGVSGRCIERRGACRGWWVEGCRGGEGRCQAFRRDDF